MTNEFSVCFIRKYAQLFDIPSDKHVFAIMQTARGHRTADLFDEQLFPPDLKLDNGNSVCLTYIAALIRLADELDITEDRNTRLMFDPEKASTEIQKMENAKHDAIKKMTIYPDRIELDVRTDHQKVYAAVSDLVNTVQRTLDECVKVVEEKTDLSMEEKRDNSSDNHNYLE